MRRHIKFQFHKKFEISQFLFDFSRFGLSAILDLFGAYLNHPQRVDGGLYPCAQLACDRCSTLDDMKVLIFGTFDFKTPIHSHPKIGVFGEFDP